MRAIQIRTCSLVRPTATLKCQAVASKSLLSCRYVKTTSSIGKHANNSYQCRRFSTDSDSHDDFKSIQRKYEGTESSQVQKWIEEV
jgi:hypothetical protein